MTNRAFVRGLLVATVVVLLAVLVVLSVLFAKVATPPGVADDPRARMEWVRSIYGFGPSADEQFAHPYSVAVASNGDIYATDPERARILVFARSGDFKRLIHTGAGGTAEGMFQRPESIALDTRDDLYIADSWANKIIVFDPDGRFVREWPVPAQPRGIAVSQGQVYVLGPGRVYVYNLAGQELLQFGSRGSRPGQIDAYQGIAVRDGRVFIADSYNRRIQAFGTQGTLDWSNPTTPSVSSSQEMTHTEVTTGWDLPQDLTFDAVGNLVVADAFGFRLVVVDPKDGEIIAGYGEAGSADGQFYYPTSVAYDVARDWFVVADTQNQRLQVVRLPGSTDEPLLPSARRIVASPARYAIPSLVALFIVLCFAVFRWIALVRAERGA